MNKSFSTFIKSLIHSTTLKVINSYQLLINDSFILFKAPETLFLNLFSIQKYLNSFYTPKSLCFMKYLLN